MTPNEIRERVTAFLGTLDPNDAKFRHHAINWADLRCVEVCEVRSWSGGPEPDEYILVRIEEAAPGCFNLCQAVAGCLTALAPSQAFHVETEW